MNWIPVRKSDVVNHFRYEFWRYLVVIVLAVAGWSMIFGFTTPVISPQERVDIKVVGYLQQDELVANFGNTILEDFPQLREINIEYIRRINEDDSDGYTKYSLVIGLNEGDIMIVDQNDFANLAFDGSFLIPLDDALNNGNLEPLTSEELEKAKNPYPDIQFDKIYGIPLDRYQEGFNEWGYVVKDKFMVLRTCSLNQDNAVAVMQWLQQYMLGNK